ncbi:Upstream activation factor subunit spp27 [Choanephora cucurbitarum]|uniref:Upstream activation factor subunit spp27 n=1 Tax=Choanephora cucurbitarum TaxID=101091 RepID=A0A1C7MZF3_9FUNG|nr:Upstream activation factor subunit spp27 [Choanephora cucurbitarum]
MPNPQDTNSFLDGLEFSGFYSQQQQVYPQGFYSLPTYSQQQQQQQQMQPPPMQNYIPSYNQVLLQRYNSNGSNSSTNSQPAYHLPPQTNYMQYLPQQQTLQDLKMYYQSFPQFQPQKKTKKESSPAGGIQKKKPKTKKKRVKVIDPNAPPKPKRKTGLNKPLILSPALSELMDGDKELSRPELVRKLWKYIKTNDLQDPADRRFILCDEKLKKIFDQDRVNSFGMNKDLSAHLTKKEEPIEETGVTTAEDVAVTAIAENEPQEKKEEEEGFLMNL